jgi:hypothetical protein
MSRYLEAIGGFGDLPLLGNIGKLNNRHAGFLDFFLDLGTGLSDCLLNLPQHILQSCTGL